MILASVSTTSYGNSDIAGLDFAGRDLENNENRR